MMNPSTPNPYADENIKPATTRWLRIPRVAFISGLALLTGLAGANAVAAGKREQRSPDGKFAAVHVTQDEGSANWRGHISLVELPSRRVLVPDFMIDFGTAEQLWWAPNSKRFAIFARPGTRIGATAVYEREDDEFIEIELPEIDHLWDEKREEAIALRIAKLGWEESRATRRIEDYVKPLRWLSADTLVLELLYINFYLKEGTELTKRIQARCEVVVTFPKGDEPAKIRRWGPIKVSMTD